MRGVSSQEHYPQHRPLSRKQARAGRSRLGADAGYDGVKNTMIVVKTSKHKPWPADVLFTCHTWPPPDGRWSRLFSDVKAHAPSCPSELHFRMPALKGCVGRVQMCGTGMKHERSLLSSSTPKAVTPALVEVSSFEVTMMNGSSWSFTSMS